MRRRNRQPSGLSDEDRRWIAQAIADCIKTYYMPDALAQVRREAIDEVLSLLTTHGVLPRREPWGQR